MQQDTRIFCMKFSLMSMIMIRKKIAHWLSCLAHKFNPELIKPVPANIQAPIIGELLKNKTVLVTGAAGSIGSAIAQEVVAQGATVVLVDINIVACDALVSQLGTDAAQCVGCDVSNEKNIDSLCKTLISNNLNVDIVIHAAGIQYERAPGEPMEPAQWRDTFNTNVTGPAYLSERLKNLSSPKPSDKNTLCSSGGLQSILFISSIHQTGVVGWPSYSSSKAALAMLVKELAVEFAGSGIRVNSIAPGWVALDEQQQPLCSRYSLLKRESVSPQSIARAAVFLSSQDCSAHTSGATLTIDGAMSLFNHRVDIQYKV